MAEYFKVMPYKQDLPPPGGYPKLSFTQNLPKRGITGVTLMAAGLGVMVVGFSFVIKGNRKRRELGKEKMNARLSILPVLLAEQDRGILRRLKENFEAEKIIMKDVEGWEPGKNIYYTDKWVRPRPEQLIKL
ncbi:NADH dehydrogenase [ubiquinone] 1 alpha subcomplex subunit 13-like [Hydra vulgaris]|uniref:NADH dehydrogenase [ubiquinone] 1 alpha subcomplex subunit 13 n=1 Tax=Hydra vulgaris TaxID=6087 RepID=A0ABM4D9I2_HYDVU